jgi:FkbM family methyltransferase
MIVNVRDYKQEEGGTIGVAVELFQRSHYDDAQLDLLCKLLDMRREVHGDGVFVIDGGANIGTYTLLMARMMATWGSVIAFEPQERLFYALAGNIVINNCANAKAVWGAVGHTIGTVKIPVIDYNKPGNFGGVSLVNPQGPCEDVAIYQLDQFNFKRVDMLKLDVEGMELDALNGAKLTIERCKPIICAEHIICGAEKLTECLEVFGYAVQMTGMNILGLHKDDPVGKRIRWYDSQAEAA